MSEKVCKAALFFLSETCSRGRWRGNKAYTLFRCYLLLFFV